MKREVVAAVVMAALSAQAEKVISVRLPVLPTTRTIVAFSRADQLEYEVTFDPAVDFTLSKRVVVPDNAWPPQSARVSSVARLNTKGEPLANPYSGAWTLVPEPVELKLDKTTMTIAFVEVPGPTVAGGLARLGAGVAAQSGEARSIEADVGKVVEETLKLLAQIALDRARARGIALLTNELTNWVCQLTVDGKKAVLPSTCAVLSAARFEELVSSPRPLLRAVAADALALLPAPNGTSLQKTLLREIRRLAADSIVDGRPPGQRELIAALVSVGHSSVASSTDLQIALAVVGECGAQSECGLSELRELVGWLKAKDPETTFRWAQQALSIVRPPEKVTERELALRWLRLSCDVLSGQAGAEDLCAAASSLFSGELAPLLAVAVKQVRAQSASAENGARLEKISRLVVGMTHYAEVYRSTAKDDAAAAAEARKAALESLIDSMTDRRGREGAMVLSLGALTGISYFSATDSAVGPWLQLSLPLGLAFQSLPKGARGVGFLAQLSIFDLGAYLPVSGPKFVVPSPLQALHVGAQVGVTYGSPSDSVGIGVCFRYAPAMQIGLSPATLEVGVWLAYYVPFLDLN